MKMEIQNKATTPLEVNLKSALSSHAPISSVEASHPSLAGEVSCPGMSNHPLHPELPSFLRHSFRSYSRRQRDPAGRFGTLYSEKNVHDSKDHILKTISS